MGNAPRPIRNKDLSRRKEDYYGTPRWVVYALLNNSDIPEKLPIVEPCVGQGDLLLGLQTKMPDREYLTNDLYSEGGQDMCRYVRGLDRDCIVITNPPYRKNGPLKLWQACCENPFVQAVYLLVSTDWLGSHKRNSILTRYTPGVIVIPNRISFVGMPEKNTGPTYHQWVEWKRNEYVPTVRICESLPPEYREL